MLGGLVPEPVQCDASAFLCPGTKQHRDVHALGEQSLDDGSADHTCSPGDKCVFLRTHRTRE